VSGLREDRLFGPPGTGKTTTLSKWVRRAADKVGAQSIVVGSFTKTAAAEIASRGIPVPDSQVGTLHALAYRALGIERGTIADDAEKLGEWNARHPRYALTAGKKASDDDIEGPAGKTLGDELYGELQTLRARLVDEKLYPARVFAFRNAWTAWKDELRLLDFTDLIEAATYDVALPAPGVTVGFFDEAQDFTAMELRLVRTWAENMENVVLAGDDDQTIYFFKGARPEAFLQPPLPEERKHVLRQSYRVPAVVQRAAEAWVAQVGLREPKEYRPRAEEGFAKATAATWKNPLPLVRLLEADLEAGRSPMVLATAGYMLGPLQATLRGAGLAYHNPYRLEDYHLNPLRPGRGVSASQRLLAYHRPDPEAWGAEARLWTARELYWALEHLRAKGVVIHGAKAYLDEASRTQDGVERELDWAELAAYVDLDALDEGFARPSLEWYEANLLKAKAPGFVFPLAIARRRGVAALREEPRIVLGTVHSVKGGEADVVYLVPDLSPAADQAWNGGGAARDAVVRTFYVAMTRARLGLVVLSAAGASVPLRSSIARALAA